MSRSSVIDQEVIFDHRIYYQAGRIPLTYLIVNIALSFIFKLYLKFQRSKTIEKLVFKICRTNPQKRNQNIKTDRQKELIKTFNEIVIELDRLPLVAFCLVLPTILE